MEDDGSDSPAMKEFHLPEDEYGELMDQRRLDPEGTASPSQNDRKKRRLSGMGMGVSRKSASLDNTGGTDTAGEEESELDSETPSSPISARSAPTRRGGRGRGRGGARGRRGGRRAAPPKEETVQEETVDENDDDDDDGNTAADDDGSEAESETNAESPVSTPKASRRGKATATPRGRGGRRKQEGDIRRSTRKK